MTGMIQGEFIFADPTEPFRVLPHDPTAFFTLNWLSPEGRLNRQKAFALDEMETVLGLTGGVPNLYMSQCLLDRPVRRTPFVQYGTHSFVDLDYYKHPALAEIAPDRLASDIRSHCDDTGTPRPSAIIRSGRGIYTKWYYNLPVRRVEVGRMAGVNRALARRLDRFGADHHATDCTRLLRVTGSKHTGANRVVDLLWLEQSGGQTITYEFDTLARDLTPPNSTEPENARDVPGSPLASRSTRFTGSHFTRPGWFWSIIEDCYTLASLRWGGQVPEGWRDLFGHVIACSLARVVDARGLYQEIVAHTRLILPADYVQQDLQSHSSSLLAKAREGHSYRYGKSRLMDLLRVQPSEERHMRALISEAEKDRREAERQRAKRRADGVRERVKYEATAAARRSEVARMRERGVTFRAIAVELGISVAEAHRLYAPGRSGSEG